MAAVRGSDWIDWDRIRRVQAESFARAHVWKPYYPPPGTEWNLRLYFAMVRWARIPELGVLTDDHRGWGAWRWLYLVPFLFVRYCLLRMDTMPPPTFRDTWRMATKWYPRRWVR
jgi:hypothetical protein